MKMQRLILAGACVGMLSGLFAVAPWSEASAQEVTQEHTTSARAVMKATGASVGLDSILPQVAEFTKTGLISNRPDIEGEISIIVDEQAIALAPRRKDLESEVAAVYSKLFTKEELDSIATFFASDAGQKYLQLSPSLLRQVDEISKVWRTGITRDLAQQVQQKLSESGLQ